jgi:hypothetical protein
MARGMTPERKIAPRISPGSAAPEISGDVSNCSV